MKLLLSDIMKLIIGRITPVMTINSVEALGSGRYKFLTSKTYYLTPKKKLTIGGDTYVVDEVVKDEYFILINGISALTDVTSVALYTPKFKHGSPYNIQEDLLKMKDEQKYPLFLIHNLISTQDKTTDWQSTYAYEWDFTVFILDVVDFAKWSVDEHESYVVKPMVELLNELSDVVNADKKLFEELRDKTVINRVNFGVYQTDKGEVKQLYTENWSGIEVRLKLQYRKTDCCPFTPELPTTTKVTINDVNFANVLCGTQVDVTVENEDGNLTGGLSELGVWVVPNGGDATVENTDQSFQVTIPAGDTEVLEDYEFEFQDADGNILDTEFKPAMIGDTYIVGAGGSCPTEFSYDLYVNGEFYETITIDINENINITT